METSKPISGEVIREKKKRPFTAVSNELIRTKLLTVDERFLIIYLESLPNDWVIYKTTLHTQIGMAEFRLDTVWKSLKEKNFIHSFKTIDANGKFNGWNHIFFDSEECLLKLASKNTKADMEESTISSIPEVGENRDIINKDFNTNKDILKKKKGIFGFLNDLGYSQIRIETITKWLEYKKQKGNPYKEIGLKSWLKKMEKFDDDFLNHLVGNSMANNWQGILDDKDEYIQNQMGIFKKKQIQAKKKQEEEEVMPWDWVPETKLVSTFKLNK